MADTAETVYLEVRWRGRGPVVCQRGVGIDQTEPDPRGDVGPHRDPGRSPANRTAAQWWASRNNMTIAILPVMHTDTISNPITDAFWMNLRMIQFPFNQARKNVATTESTVTEFDFRWEDEETWLLRQEWLSCILHSLGLDAGLPWLNQGIGELDRSDRMTAWEIGVMGSVAIQTDCRNRITGKITEKSSEHSDRPWFQTAVCLPMSKKTASPGATPVDAELINYNDAGILRHGWLRPGRHRFWRNWW
jgi:hypothetical protein